MAGNVDYEGDIDLYDELFSEDGKNLTAEQLKEFEELKNECLVAKNKIIQLESEIDTAEKRNRILKQNISVLYKTAKLEISRKDFLLNELQRRYDQLLFRRGNKSTGENPQCKPIINPGLAVTNVRLENKSVSDTQTMANNNSKVVNCQKFNLSKDSADITRVLSLGGMADRFKNKRSEHVQKVKNEFPEKDHQSNYFKVEKTHRIVHYDARNSIKEEHGTKNCSQKPSESNLKLVADDKHRRETRDGLERQNSNKLADGKRISSKTEISKFKTHRKEVIDKTNVGKSSDNKVDQSFSKHLTNSVHLESDKRSRSIDRKEMERRNCKKQKVENHATNGERNKNIRTCNMSRYRERRYNGHRDNFETKRDSEIRDFTSRRLSNKPFH